MVIDITLKDSSADGGADDLQEMDRARIAELATTLPIDKAKLLLSALDV